MPMNYDQNGRPNFIGHPNQMPDPRMGGYMQQPSGYPPNQQQFMAQNTQQAYSPFQVAPTFPGRYVEGLDEVKPNEVPMDGQLALFPTKDLSVIYLKSWSGDGRILNFRYILDTSVDLNAPVVPQQQEDYTNISARLSALEEQVKKKTSARGRNKPEEEATTNA